MRLMPRLSVRQLLEVIAGIAIALGILRYPYLVIQAQLRFNQQTSRGQALIATYRSLRPPEFSTQQWDNAVGNVHTTWVNVAFSPEHIAQGDLDDLLNQVRTLVDRASPATAEGELYAILDLLAHAKTRASGGYLSGRRFQQKLGLQGEGRPSPGVVRFALALVGPAPKDPVADLPAALEHQDWKVRVMACRALKEVGLGGRMDVAVAAQIRALKDSDPLVREVAVESLNELGPGAGGALPALAEVARRDPSSRVRARAAPVLPRLEPSLREAIPWLIAALRDPDRGVRHSAVVTLGQLGPKAQPATPALVEVLERDRDGEVRAVTAEALGAIGPTSQTVPALIGALRREPGKGYWMVTYESARALEKIGPEAAPAIPTLTAVIRIGSPNERSAAIRALGGIGPAARTTLPILLEALRDPESRVRAAAAETLGAIGAEPGAVIPPLIEALRDSDSSVRAAAATGLGRLGTPAREAIPALSAALGDEDFWVVEEAKASLRKIRDE